MDLLRRDFLKFGVTQALAAAVALPSVASQNDEALHFQNQRRDTPSILQGATCETKTQFSILHHKSLKFHPIVQDGFGRIWQADKIELITNPQSDFQLTKVYFSNLRVDQIFYLDLMSDEGARIERREFGLLDTQKKNLRFALCSCMDDARHESGIWQDLIERRPDVIFFIGDSVYVDYKDKHIDKDNPSRLWKRFSEARRTLEIYYSKRLIPIFATWDDHDFGKDNCNSESYPHVKLSQKNFLSYFAQEESHCSALERGPGVSSAFKAGKHLFVLMDDRSYRLDDGDESRYAHWGQEQEVWALDLIQEHSGITWLMNGSQIFPQMIYKESMSGGHRNQFLGFMRNLRQLNKKVIFASGDVHFSEISKIESEKLGYQTFEVTSSSMHSRCFPGLQHIALNRRRVVSTTKRNYILVDSSANDHHSIANVYSCSAGERVNFSRQLKV